MNKQAMTVSFLIKLILGLLMLGILIFMINRFSTPALDVVNKCNAFSPDALYIPRTVYDAQVANRNVIIADELHEGQSFICATPVPGQEDEFRTLYEEYYAHTLNTGKDMVGGTPAAGNNTASSFARQVPQNTKVRFYVNNQLVEQKLSHFYSPELPPNSILEPGVAHTFRVESDYTDANLVCEVSFTPARVDYGDDQRILQTTGASQEFIYPKNTQAELITVLCTELFEFSMDPLLALSDTQYKVPGFYKWDYVVRNIDTDSIVGSASTFIAAEEDTSNLAVGSGAVVQQVKLLPIEYETRNNLRTCYVTPYIEADKSFPEFTFETSYVPQPSGSYPDVGSQQTTLFLQENIGMSLGPYYAHLKFSHSGSQELLTLSGTDCDEIKVRNYQFNQVNFNCAQSQCSSFNGRECRDPMERDTNACDQFLTNCQLDPNFLGGRLGASCESCDLIRECAHYDDEESCNSNQCLGGVNLNDRCFWNTDGPNECLTCNYNQGCEQYKDHDACEADACQLEQRVSSLSCTWANGACS